VALSMIEVEYVVECTTSRGVVWIRKMLSRLFGLGLEVTCIWCDSKSCMNLSENLVFHDR
jgi:hypothetical protein